MVKSLNKNISIPIAVIIILLITVLAGGILVWQYWRAPGKVSSPASNQKEREEIGKKMGEDETAGWKIYQSPTMGFVMKYPPDWTTTPEIVEDGGKRVTFQHPGGVESEAEIVVMRGESHYSYDKDKELSCDESGTEKKEIVLDNLPAFISTTYYPEVTKTTYICEEIKRTEIYLTIYDYDEDKENLYYPIFNKMLSTFKITGDINFSESYNSSIFKDWKVYKNYEYGFEVKYPSEDYEISAENYTKAGPAIISNKWGAMVIFEIHNNPSSLSLAEWAANYYPSIKWRNILVNNLESLMSSHSAYQDFKIGGKWRVLIYKKDKIAEIVFGGWGAEGESSKLDNILSTFMFLE